MSAQSVKREIDRLTVAFLEQGIAINHNSTTLVRDRKQTIVTWNSVDVHVLSSTVFATIQEFRELVEKRQYTMILLDGSLLQLSYVFERNNLVKHRLGYFPCPFVMDPSDITGLGLIDLIDILELDGFSDSIRLRSPLRFDYDRDAAKPGHPASHLHLSHEECRVPVHSPLCIGRFLDFVFRHFYPTIWEEQSFIRRWPRQRLTRCIDEQDRKHLHFERVE